MSGSRDSTARREFVMRDAGGQQKRDGSDKTDLPDIRELRLQTDASSANNSFPIALETGGRTVQEIRVAYAENLTTPSAAWANGGCFVFWRKGQSSSTAEIRYISGLALSTAYLFRLIIEYSQEGSWLGSSISTDSSTQNRRR